MITTFQDLYHAVDSLSITDYLNKVGIDVPKNNKIHCLNPDHDDRNPSMTIYDDRGYARCFGCSFYGGIIDLHSSRTGLDKVGQEFVTLVKQIADLFEIEYSLIPLNPDDLRKLEYYNIYSLVTRNLKQIDSKEHPKLYKFISERGWDPQKLLELGVGYFDTDDVICPTGVDSTNGYGIWDTDLFSNCESKLVTTFYDSSRRPVGFAVRYVDFVDKKSIFPKWKSTSGHVPIFDKSSLLYNYIQAKKALKNGKDILYIFEGQGSCITAYHYGIPNTVAIGGSSILPGQRRLLKDLNPSKYVLVLDPDKSGVEGTASAIKEVASLLGGHRLYVKDLRDENDYDPDEYIRNNSVDAFLQLKEESAFDWLYMYLVDKVTQRDAVDELIKLIATFHSPLEREDLSKSLSIKTGYSVSSIMEEVDNIVNQKELTQKQLIRDITDNAVIDMKRNPTASLAILDGLRSRIEAIQADTNVNVSTGDFFLEEMLRFQEEAEAHGETFPGFQMPLMPKFAEAFNNDWSKGRMICIGGEENAGKSSFSSFMCYNLALEEANNNLHVLYMTIDDSVPELFPKYVAMAGRHRTKGYRNYENGFPLEINHVVRPSYWAKRLRDINPQLEVDMLHAYKTGYNAIKRMAKEERLVLFGIPHAQTLEDFERAIAGFRKRYPHDNIFAYLDNIHKLPLEGGDARLAFKSISNRVKNSSVRHNVAVGGTLEYNSDSTKRQKDSRPTNASLAESRSFRYDASAIVHIYNHKHVYQEQSPWYHEVRDFSRPHLVHQYPVIEGIIGKNKISGDKNTHAFKFIPPSSWFEEVPLHEIAQIVKMREDNDKGLVTKGNIEVWATEED